jgi:hypothetical protein
LLIISTLQYISTVICWQLEKENDLREELSAAEAELAELALALSVTTSDSSVDDVTATADTAAIAEAMSATAAGDSEFGAQQQLQQQQQQQQHSTDERTAAQPSIDSSSSEWIVVSMEGDSPQGDRPLDSPFDVSEHVSTDNSSQCESADHSVAAAATADTDTTADAAAAATDATATDDGAGDGDSTAANDELFTRGVLTALSSAPLPALANVAFARATKLTGGVSIKHTRYVHLLCYLISVLTHGCKYMLQYIGLVKHSYTGCRCACARAYKHATHCCVVVFAACTQCEQGSSPCCKTMPT